VWIVEFESRIVEQESERLIASGNLSEDDRRVISSWVRQVTFHGPESVRQDGKWADHPLTGEWKGYRSSAFSNSGRIIYWIEEKVVKVKIARITDDHDYRKKGRS
jgi:mRNA-degrading endonuclease YafQ of YafQ-DinJ toxin-antitoxin module